MKVRKKENNQKPHHRERTMVYISMYNLPDFSMKCIYLQNRLLQYVILNLKYFQTVSYDQLVDQKMYLVVMTSIKIV